MVQHSSGNPTSSLLTSMFGPTDLEKGIKIEKLLDRKSQIAFNHGRVEGNLMLGAAPDKWAKDANARRSLEKTIGKILKISKKEKVHVLSVGRVTVNGSRRLMRLKR